MLSLLEYPIDEENNKNHLKNHFTTMSRMLRYWHTSLILSANTSMHNYYSIRKPW